MSNKEDIELDRVCRSCLRVDENMHFLFSSAGEPIHGNTPYLHQMLASSAQINITENDGLPHQICSGCVEMLYSAFSFKFMCEQSDSKLRRVAAKKGYALHVKTESFPTGVPCEKPSIRKSIQTQTESDYLQTFSCPDCQKKFRSLLGLNLHLKHHDERNSHACHNCNHLIPEDKVKEHARGCAPRPTADWQLPLSLHIKQEPDCAPPPSPLPSPAASPLSAVVKRELSCDESDYEPLKFSVFKKKRNSHKMKTKSKKIGYDSREKFPCKLCPKKLSSEVQLQVHTAKHSGIVIPYTCSVCQKGFGRYTHLKRHRSIHSPAQRVACLGCGASFGRRELLSRHVCGRPDQVPEHQCQLCPKAYAGPRQLQQHHDSVHGDRPAYCAACQRHFSSQRALERHRVLHDGALALPCAACELTFPSRRLLRAHARSHRGPARPFLCSECGGSFVRKSDLAVHTRRHRGEKPYACRFCPKLFTRRTDLTIHERYHTEDKAHVCAVCGKSFHRQYNLKVHLRVHSGERPYACPHCGKAFTQGNDLKAHVRRHTGERYACELCKEVFIQAYHLTRHKRTVHKLECPVPNRRVEKHPEVPPEPRAPRAQHLASKQLLAAHMAALLAQPR